jgi:predicted lipoprotein with Yx(FWY)xxD motif
MIHSTPRDVFAGVITSSRNLTVLNSNLPYGKSTFLIAALLTALAVAACAQPAGSAATPTPSLASTPSPTATASASATPDMSHAGTVEVASSALGNHLAGADGKALYLLLNDSAGTSTCVDSCAQNWPPFVLGEGETPTAGDGVTGELGTITRPDGSMQVSINGLPLYYFAGDSAAGDTNGQGINDVWFLAAPDGTPLMATAAGTSPGSSATSDYPY